MRKAFRSYQTKNGQFWSDTPVGGRTSTLPNPYFYFAFLFPLHPSNTHILRSCTSTITLVSLYKNTSQWTLTISRGWSFDVAIVGREQTLMFVFRSQYSTGLNTQQVSQITIGPAFLSSAVIKGATVHCCLLFLLPQTHSQDQVILSCFVDISSIIFKKTCNKVEQTHEAALFQESTIGPWTFFLANHQTPYK